MSGVRMDAAHIAAILEKRAPDRPVLTPEETEQVERALAQYAEQQGWQRAVDDLIVRLQTRLQEGPADQKEAAPPLTVYTDGACIGNPGPGGWCAIIGTPEQPADERVVLQGSHWDTTNNRMEMQAIISALQHAGPDVDVEVWSDSQYVCKAFNEGWLRRWQRNGWRTTTGAVLNQDLWTTMVSLVEGNGQRRVTFQWVRGHSGNALNEQADRHAREEAQKAGGHRTTPQRSGPARRRGGGRRPPGRQ